MEASIFWRFSLRSIYKQGVVAEDIDFCGGCPGEFPNSELLMCRKFTLIFTTNFVGSLDIRAFRKVFPIGVRSPEISYRASDTKITGLLQSVTSRRVEFIFLYTQPRVSMVNTSTGLG
jgi:hypothetical protein